MTTDNARTVLADPRAPADERFDAEAELTKSVMPTASDLMPSEGMLAMINYMRDSYQQQADDAMFKSLTHPNVVPFPSKNVREKRPGMQSVQLDDVQFSVMGEFYEKPGSFAYDSMRAMVDQTPILSSVILTRIRQVARFCRVQENGKGPGFEIRMREKDANASNTNKDSIKALQDFFTHTGWEKNPRARARLKRDGFPTLMAKLTRDSLVLDSAPIETEFKKDRSLGMDGIYAVDGATIRLCNEEGYQGEDEIRALQVVQGRIRSAYTFDDLIYVPRNPRTDVLVGGYGFSETEILVKTVTGMLNAMTYNTKFFDSNAIPKGLLHLHGTYDERDLAAFKRMWSGMVKGINNAWALPVMVSKDQESAAKFEQFGQPISEMMFGKWISFLTAIICAVYGIGPDEINFESFKTTAGGLNGNDTEEKLTSSKDKGLRPLLSYFENLFTDYIVSDFSDQYVFRWTGLDDEDEKQVFERQKLTMTVNEMRALDSLDEITEAWGNAPINPTLIGPWQAENQAQQEDFGTPGPDGEAEPAQDGGQPDFGEDQGGGAAPDFGDGGDDAAAPGAPAPRPERNAEPLGKSFGMPEFTPAYRIDV